MLEKVKPVNFLSVIDISAPKALDGQNYFVFIVKQNDTLCYIDYKGTKWLLLP